MPYRLADQVAYEVLDGEAVILDLKAARYYSLNSTATCSWQRLVEGDGIEDAARAVAHRFAIDRATAVADVRRLADELQSLRLLERANPERG